VQQAVYHYTRGGARDRALTALELALTHARRVGNRERVVTLYRQAIDIAASDSALTRRHADLAEALGDLYTAEEDYAEATRVYGELGPTTGSLTLLGKLGLALLAVDTRRAVQTLTQTIPAVPEQFQDDLHWRLEAGLVWALALDGREYETVRHSRDALGKLGDTAGFGEARILLRATLGLALQYQGDMAGALPHLMSARNGWEARGNQVGVSLVNNALIGLPMPDLTKIWLRVALQPLIKHET
jgi:hypothetical protein